MEIEEECEKEEMSEEELLEETLTESELDSLDPEEKKLRRKMRREEKEELSKEKAHQAQKVLEEKKAELQRTKNQLQLQPLKSKVLAGGEYLLDKAETQRQLLERASRENEQRRLIELQLQEDLHKKKAERLDLEERYSSLQEENAAKTCELKQAVQLLDSAKAELADQQREQQREMEGILDGIRALRREIQLADLVLDSYIPKEYQALIEQYVHWNEQLGEWQVKCVAYTGNNMAPHQHHQQHSQQHNHMEPPDLSDGYLSYSRVNTRPGTLLARPQTSSVPGTRLARPKTSSVPGTRLARPQISSVPDTRLVRHQTSSVPDTLLARPQTSSVPDTPQARPQTSSVPDTPQARPQTSSVPDTRLARPQTSCVPGTRLARLQTSSTPRFFVLFFISLFIVFLGFLYTKCDDDNPIVPMLNYKNKLKINLNDLN
ncbi:kinesin-like protein KIF3A [Achroia grisella]|uniref:kinesin-like protein KIF3A n=1 Tax=Achroia grisella TaxID=688607 RepID=UPI0027D2FE27|nr:kinesin-like protein KIF3A [Achroia grisella]